MLRRVILRLLILLKKSLQLLWLLRLEIIMLLVKMMVLRQRRLRPSLPAKILPVVMLWQVLRPRKGLLHWLEILLLLLLLLIHRWN